MSNFSFDIYILQMIKNFNPINMNLFVIDKLQITLHVIRSKTKRANKQKLKILFQKFCYYKGLKMSNLFLKYRISKL